MSSAPCDRSSKEALEVMGEYAERGGKFQVVKSGHVSLGSMREIIWRKAMGIAESWKTCM